MSQQPPPISMPSGYAYPPPATRTSALAVTSLVTGILGCLVITPFVAILTGILGIRATGKPGVGGRGLAIAGLVLGIVWLLIFTAGGAGFGIIWKNSEAPAAVARQFTADVIAGNYPAALANSKGMTEDELVAIHDQLAAWGANTDITLPARKATAQGGFTRWELIGTATFATGGIKGVEYVVDTKPSGGYVVAGVNFK